MLVGVLVAIRSKPLAILLRMRCLERDGISLVIAHDGKRGAAIDHGAHHAAGLELSRPAGR